MINPSVSDFRPDVDSHLFVSISLTSLSCNLFGHCPGKGFSFQMPCSCSSARSLVLCLIHLAYSIAVSFTMIAEFGISSSFSNFAASYFNDFVFLVLSWSWTMQRSLSSVLSIYAVKPMVVVL